MNRLKPDPLHFVHGQTLQRSVQRLVGWSKVNLENTEGTLNVTLTFGSHRDPVKHQRHYW